MKKFQKFVRLGLCIVLSLFFVSSAAADDYLFMLNLLTDSPNWQEFYKNEFKRIASLGYTGVIAIISTGQSPCYKTSTGVASGSASLGELRELVSYAENDLNIKFYIELKLFGKATSLIGKEYIRQHPDVVVTGSSKHPIWNPLYMTPEGKSLYQGVVFPLIDEVLSIYQKGLPSYIFVGGDESDKDAMRKVAAKMNLTIGELMAREFNISTGYLIEKGITPVVWDDMFISRKLANPNFVEGYPGDPRFRWASVANGDSAHWGGGSVMDGVLKFTNRVQCVAASWQYFNGTPKWEFPAIDYLQWLGFKEVWSASWYSDPTIQALSAYSTLRDCHVKIATTWTTAVFTEYPEMRDLYETTLHNSIVYFKNPALKPINPPVMRVFAEKTQGAFFDKGEKIIISALSEYTATNGCGKISIKKTGEASWNFQYTVLGVAKNNEHEFILELTLPAAFKSGDLVDAKFELFDKYGRLIQTIEHGFFAIH